MAYRSLEITLIGAKDLKNVNLFSQMQVYAAVALTGDPRHRQRTPPDRSGGRNPKWNSTLRLNIPVDGDISRASIHILLRTERALGDRDVGEVFVPIADILDGAGDGSSLPIFRSYQVRKVTSGRPKGVIDLSFKLGERIGALAPAWPPAVGMNNLSSYPPPVQPLQPGKVSNSPKFDEPVMAYPAAGSSSAAPYPAAPGYRYGQVPQQGYGYGYPPPPGPPQQGYGYGYGQPGAQGAYGYGYGGGAAAQPPRKNNKFGMGLGAGLLGGALGGLLIGDMISDAGYDDGFDAGGFDF